MTFPAAYHQLLQGKIITHDGRRFKAFGERVFKLNHLGGQFSELRSLTVQEAVSEDWEVEG